MLIQGDVRNLVPVKCFIKDDQEHKHKHIEFEDKVFDEDHAVNNLNLDPNPFQAGTDVSLDGDLIIQLWRDGKLYQYCRDFKFKQVYTQCQQKKVAICILAITTSNQIQNINDPWCL